MKQWPRLSANGQGENILTPMKGQLQEVRDPRNWLDPQISILWFLNVWRGMSLDGNPVVGLLSLNKKFLAEGVW